MSFSRTTYDKCAYEQNLSSSEGPGMYMLNSPIDVPCLVYEPEAGSASFAGGSHAAYSKLVDVDSELMGLTKPYSKCKKPYDCSLAADQSVKYQRCRIPLQSESTRLSNPPCTLRCNGVNRWETLCKDPQETALLPFATQVNNRLIVKDNHKPCLEFPQDQTQSMPKNVDSAALNIMAGAGVKSPYTQQPMLPQTNASTCDASYFGKL